ncbi:MAG: hypothetical protein HY543_01895 [Deltaproteobacteria bacterium]|nr:hypothetical protein [Deltaproteobacteria bacterium]
MRSNHLFHITIIGAGIILTVAGLQGCGGGSSSSDSSSGGGTTATTSSVSSIPIVDLSRASASESSSNEAVPLTKGLLEDKKKESDFKALFSRTGCEINRAKEELLRHADQINSMGCHIRKAKDAGFTIGTNEFAYNLIQIPEPPAEFKEKLDQNRKKDREFQNKTESDFDSEDEDVKMENGTMIVRAGQFDGNELRVDGALQKSGGKVHRLFEATITTDDTSKKVTAVMISKFPHGGKEEGGRIDLTAKNVTISDGVLTEASDAVVDVVGQVTGLFGSGRIEYTHDKAATLDKIRMYHRGKFTDFERGVAHDTTTTVRGVQNATCGCGTGEFTGTVPAMPASELVRNCPSDKRSTVLEHIKSADGLASLTTSSKVCPGDKKLTLADGNTCEISQSFSECYTVSVSDVSTDLGLPLKRRKYALTDAANCTGPSESNAKWESLAPVAVSVAYTRDWDGSYPADTAHIVDMKKLAPSAMKECMAYEERFRDRRGAGGEGCHEQEHRKAAENDAKDSGFTLEDKGEDAQFVGQQEEVKAEHTK